MPRYECAHIREQGQDIIIVPLEGRFGTIGDSAQAAEIRVLQIRANAAGYAGTIVPVWDAGGGRMSFVAPQPWHPFFKGLNLQVVARMINKYFAW
jgi:hypothetical protein